MAEPQPVSPRELMKDPGSKYWRWRHDRNQHGKPGLFGTSSRMLNEKTRYSSFLLGGATFALASWLVIASADAAPRSKSSDQHFMTEAIQGDLAEVRMG